MKICFLADAQNVHTQKWARFFSEKGHQVDVITFTPCEIEGVNIHPVEMSLPVVINHNVHFLKKIGYFFYINIVKNIIQKIEPDILHAHWATSYGLLGAFSNFHPYLISTWGRDIYKGLDGSFFYKQLLRFSLSKADYITATSKELAKGTQTFTSKKVLQVPFGVDVDHFKPLVNKKRGQELVIGVVKKLEPYYGIDYLVKAFSLLEKKFSNIVLWIIGEGSEKEKLRSLCVDYKIDHKVHFKGLVSQKDLPEYYNHIDIFAVPSLIESFGVVVVEAAACGLPVVATNVNGLPETVKDGETGFLVPSQNVEALADKLTLLIDDSALREGMGKKARNFVEVNYTWQNNAAEMLQLYENILDQKH